MRSVAPGVAEGAAGLGKAGGADDRIRTDDLRITNALLYQLSYVGPRSLPGGRWPPILARILHRVATGRRGSADPGG
jgi:hypothetical protein